MTKSSVNKRIRDVERSIIRLQRKDVSESEDVKGQTSLIINSLQQKLDDLKSENQSNKNKEKERKLSIKYHHVKFFERKKTTRRIHHIENDLKRLKENTNNTEKEIKKEIKHLEKERSSLLEDLVYIIYYPRHLKYISLLVSTADDNIVVNEEKKSEARKLANSNWEEDKKNGRDLVQNAMLVEYAGRSKEKQKTNNSGPKRKFSEYTEDSNDNLDKDHPLDFDDGDDYEEYLRNSFDNDTLEKEPEIIMKPKKIETKGKKIPMQESKQQENEQNMVEDPFFVEQVVVKQQSLTDEKDIRRPSTQRKRPSNFNFHITNKDTSSMTKQEMRLMEWKKKQHYKRKSN